MSAEGTKLAPDAGAPEIERLKEAVLVELAGFNSDFESEADLAARIVAAVLRESTGR